MNTIRNRGISKVALRAYRRKVAMGHRTWRRPPRRAPHLAKHEWISVQERLPDLEQFVLVFVTAAPSSYVSAAYWDEKCFWDHNWPWTVADISHWMPLPPPPPLARPFQAPQCEEGLESSSPFSDVEHLSNPVEPVSEVAARAGLLRSAGRWRWLLIPVVWGLAAMCFLLH